MQLSLKLTFMPERNSHGVLLNKKPFRPTWQPQLIDFSSATKFGCLCFPLVRSQTYLAATNKLSIIPMFYTITPLLYIFFESSRHLHLQPLKLHCFPKTLSQLLRLSYSFVITDARTNFQLLRSFIPCSLQTNPPSLHLLLQSDNHNWLHQITQDLYLQVH